MYIYIYTYRRAYIYIYSYIYMYTHTHIQSAYLPVGRRGNIGLHIALACCPFHVDCAFEGHRPRRPKPRFPLLSSNTSALENQRAVPQRLGVTGLSASVSQVKPELLLFAMLLLFLTRHGLLLEWLACPLLVLRPSRQPAVKTLCMWGHGRWPHLQTFYGPLRCAVSMGLVVLILIKWPSASHFLGITL